MNAEDTRRFEMIVSSNAVALENRAIIERAADGAEMIANLDAVVTNLRRHFSTGETGTREGHGTTITRREARRATRLMLDSIRRFAASLGTTGLDEKFQIPKSCSDQRLAAIGRGVIEQATPLLDGLVRRGMPKVALDDLASHVHAIDDAIAKQNVAKEDRVAAHVGIQDSFKIAMDILKQIDAIMRTANDPAALAKWKSQRRLGPRQTKDAAPATVPAGVTESPTPTKVA